ncbi:MAG: putative transposase [Maribacter sp.]|jgi:putative transposase
MRKEPFIVDLSKSTVYQAWMNTRKTRAIKKGFIFHSDRGAQYTSNKITPLFSFNRNLIQSRSRKGNYWDNAVAESFSKLLNTNGSIDSNTTPNSQLYDSII